MNRVYYNYEFWDVKQVIKLNEFDCYLLLYQLTEYLHEDEKTQRESMILIDVNEDVFCFDNDVVREFDDQLQKHAKKTSDIQEKINDLWLEDIKKIKNDS